MQSSRFPLHQGHLPKETEKILLINQRGDNIALQGSSSSPADISALMILGVVSTLGSNNEPSYYRHAFQMVLATLPDLSVTRHLPHINLPLGNGEAAITLKIVVDSCAGLNIGDLSYHMAIKDLYPLIVAQLVNLTDTGHSVKIEGVENDAAGVTISHISAYFMVMIYCGHPA